MCFNRQLVLQQIESDFIRAGAVKIILIVIPCFRDGKGGGGQLIFNGAAFAVLGMRNRVFISTRF